MTKAQLTIRIRRHAHGLLALSERMANGDRVSPCEIANVASVSADLKDCLEDLGRLIGQQKQYVVTSAGSVEVPL